MSEEHWAKCSDCNNEMVPGGSCDYNYVGDEEAKQLFQRIPYGQEMRYGDMDFKDHCHDCNVALGKYHHMGCDWEECPKCHKQMWGCGCTGVDHVHNGKELCCERSEAEPTYG